MRSKTKPFLKLRAAIVEAGYTQGDVAKAIGVETSTFSLKINGHRDFTLQECIRIANLVNRSLDDLFSATNFPIGKKGRGLIKC